MAVAISRLRVRGPPDIASRASFLIEDACRTELPDGERLILVRKLALGPESIDRQPATRASAMRRAYEEATRDARHGGSDSAAGANCVWFASRAEARRLLLRDLLAGRVPHAWFWRLAVPEWRGQPLAEWLGRMLQEADREGDESGALDLLVAAAESGKADIVLEAAAFAVTGSEAWFPHEHPVAMEVTRLSSERPDPVRLPPERIGRMLAQIRGGSPPPFVRLVEVVVRQIGVTSRTAALLLERLLIKASPSLVLSSSLLHDLVRAYAEQLADPAALPATAAELPSAKQQAVIRSAGVEQSRMEPSVRPHPPQPDSPPTAPVEQALEEPAPPFAPAEEAELPQPLWIVPIELASEAAGLWLMLPSLIRMGFREWLAERPDLLVGDAGRALIRTIATHHRVDLDDPTLQPVIPDDRPFLPPDWALLWRTGLDRWLRRRACMPLARLIWKAGWIRLAEDRLVVRFPLDSADIRLRRRALDVDPGWTDWLGLSVRYIYAERGVP